MTCGGLPDHVAVGSRKARLLLALLAVSRGRVVPTDRIVDVLWTGQRPRRPEREVATLVSRLRAALGAGVVLGGPAGYRLGDPPAVRVDLDEAALLLDECRARLARGQAAVAAAAGRRACALLGDGPVLADVPDADWVVDLRAEHAAQLRAARHATAEALLRAGDATGAVETAQAAVRADRLDEPAHRLLMAAHQPVASRRGRWPCSSGCARRWSRSWGSIRRPKPVPCTWRCSPRPPDWNGRGTVSDHARDGARRSGPGGPRRRGGPARRGLGRGDSRSAHAAPGCRRGWHRQDPAGGGVRADRREHRRTGAHAPAATPASARCSSSRSSTRSARPLAALPRPGCGRWPGRARPPHRPVARPRRPARGVRRAQHRRRSRSGGPTRPSPRVLRGLAADRPTLLLLDDLHNAGLATVELLHYLARHAAPAPGCSCSPHCAPRRVPTPSTSWPTSPSGSTSDRCRTRR